MSRLGRAALALPLLLVLAGCGASDQAGAMVACERAVDRRAGVELEHRGPLDGASAVQGPAGAWVVRSGFTEPGSRRLTSYVCTVERVEDGWRLVDLVADR